MTKYEEIMSKVGNLTQAMHRASSESGKNVLFLQAERLKYKAYQMTVREAMEPV